MIPNEITFIIHTLLIAACALVSLYLGQQALITFICMQIVTANIMVSKAITLCGLQATGADAFIIGALFGFHMLQEFYGREITKKTIWLSFYIMVVFVLFSQIHLIYLPSACDVTDPHFKALFSLMPRIIIASLTSYLVTQQFDCFLYEKIRQLFHNRAVSIRNYICASVSQLCDTILFSFLGLYGVVNNIGQIIIVSYTLKLIALALVSPCMVIAQKIMSKKDQ